MPTRPYQPSRLRIISNMNPSQAVVVATAQTQWKLDSNIQRWLDRYYLQCWRGATLQSEIMNSRDCSIIHQDVRYEVIWHDCTPTDCYDSDAVMLSFRQFHHIIGYPNVVLVTPRKNVQS